MPRLLLLVIISLLMVTLTFTSHRVEARNEQCSNNALTSNRGEFMLSGSVNDEIIFPNPVVNCDVIFENIPDLNHVKFSGDITSGSTILFRNVNFNKASQGPKILFDGEIDDIGFLILENIRADWLLDFTGGARQTYMAMMYNTKGIVDVADNITIRNVRMTAKSTVSSTIGVDGVVVMMHYAQGVHRVNKYIQDDVELLAEELSVNSASSPVPRILVYLGPYLGGLKTGFTAVGPFNSIEVSNSYAKIRGIGDKGDVAVVLIGAKVEDIGSIRVDNVTIIAEFSQTPSVTAKFIEFTDLSKNITNVFIGGGSVLNITASVRAADQNSRPFRAAAILFPASVTYSDAESIVLDGVSLYVDATATQPVAGTKNAYTATHLLFAEKAINNVKRIELRNVLLSGSVKAAALTDTTLVLLQSGSQSIGSIIFQNARIHLESVVQTEAQGTQAYLNIALMWCKGTTTRMRSVHVLDGSYLRVSSATYEKLSPAFALLNFEGPFTGDASTPSNISVHNSHLAIGGFADDGAGPFAVGSETKTGIFMTASLLRHSQTASNFGKIEIVNSTVFMRCKVTASGVGHGPCNTSALRFDQGAKNMGEIAVSGVWVTGHAMPNCRGSTVTVIVFNAFQAGSVSDIKKMSTLHSGVSVRGTTTGMDHLAFVTFFSSDQASPGWNCDFMIWHNVTVDFVGAGAAPAVASMPIGSAAAVFKNKNKDFAGVKVVSVSDARVLFGDDAPLNEDTVTSQVQAILQKVKTGDAANIPAATTNAAHAWVVDLGDTVTKNVGTVQVVDSKLIVVKAASKKFSAGFLKMGDFSDMVMDPIATTTELFDEIISMIGSSNNYNKKVVPSYGGLLVDGCFAEGWFSGEENTFVDAIFLNPMSMSAVMMGNIYTEGATSSDFPSSSSFLSSPPALTAPTSTSSTSLLEAEARARARWLKKVGGIQVHNTILKRLVVWCGGSTVGISFLRATMTPALENVFQIAIVNVSVSTFAEVNGAQYVATSVFSPNIIGGIKNVSGSILLDGIVMEDVALRGTKGAEFNVAVVPCSLIDIGNGFIFHNIDVAITLADSAEGYIDINALKVLRSSTVLSNISGAAGLTLSNVHIRSRRTWGAKNGVSATLVWVSANAALGRFDAIRVVGCSIRINNTVNASCDGTDTSFYTLTRCIAVALTGAIVGEAESTSHVNSMIEVSNNTVELNIVRASDAASTALSVAARTLRPLNVVILKAPSSGKVPFPARYLKIENNVVWVEFVTETSSTRTATIIEQQLDMDDGGKNKHSRVAICDKFPLNLASLNDGNDNNNAAAAAIVVSGNTIQLTCRPEAKLKVAFQSNLNVYVVSLVFRYVDLAASLDVSATTRQVGKDVPLLCDISKNTVALVCASASSISGQKNTPTTPQDDVAGIFLTTAGSVRLEVLRVLECNGRPFKLSVRRNVLLSTPVSSVQEQLQINNNNKNVESTSSQQKYHRYDQETPIAKFLAPKPQVPALVRFNENAVSFAGSIDMVGNVLTLSNTTFVNIQNNLTDANAATGWPFQNGNNNITIRGSRVLDPSTEIVVVDELATASSASLKMVSWYFCRSPPSTNNEHDDGFSFSDHHLNDAASSPAVPQATANVWPSSSPGVLERFDDKFRTIFDAVADLPCPEEESRTATQNATASHSNTGLTPTDNDTTATIHITSVSRSMSGPTKSVSKTLSARTSSHTPVIPPRQSMRSVIPTPARSAGAATSMAAGVAYATMSRKISAISALADCGKGTSTIKPTTATGAGGANNNKNQKEVIDVPPLEMDSNPLFIRIGSSRFSTYRGTIVGAPIIVIAWLAVALLVAFIKSKVEEKKELEKAIRDVHIPGTGVVPAVVFFPACATAFATMAKLHGSDESDDSSNNKVDVAIISLGAIVAIVFPIGLFSWIAYKLHTTEKLQKSKKKKSSSSSSSIINGNTRTTETEASWKLFLKYFFDPTREWRPTRFVRQWSPAFNSFSSAIFVVAEFVVICGIAVADGISSACGPGDSSCCQSSIIIMLVCTAVDAILIVALRPYLVRFEMVALPLVVLGNLVTVSLAAVNFFSEGGDDGPLFAAIAISSQVDFYFIMVAASTQVLVEMIPILYAGWESVSRKCDDDGDSYDGGGGRNNRRTLDTGNNLQRLLREGQRRGQQHHHLHDDDDDDDDAIELLAAPPPRRGGDHNSNNNNNKKNKTRNEDGTGNATRRPSSSSPAAAGAVVVMSPRGGDSGEKKHHRHPSSSRSRQERHHHQHDSNNNDNATTRDKTQQQQQQQQQRKNSTSSKANKTTNQSSRQQSSLPKESKRDNKNFDKKR